MSFAILPGTTSWMHIDTGPTPEGWIRVEEEPPAPIVEVTLTSVKVIQDTTWDEKLQRIRVQTPEELVATQQIKDLAKKRAAAKDQVVGAIVDSVLSGKIPSDPVMADVAAKVAAADVAVVATIDPVVIGKL